MEFMDESMTSGESATENDNITMPRSAFRIEIELAVKEAIRATTETFGETVRSLQASMDQIKTLVVGRNPEPAVTNRLDTGKSVFCVGLDENVFKSSDICEYYNNCRASDIVFRSMWLSKVDAVKLLGSVAFFDECLSNSAPMRDWLNLR